MSIYDNKKWIHSSKDVPNTEHYAILYFSSFTVPGDERSRTAPGHGYPEHTEDTVEYVVFSTKEAWENEIKDNMLSTYRKDFKAIHVTPASVSTKIDVSVKIT